MPRKRGEKAAPVKTSLITEDWLAVIIAFVLILLSVVGLLGPNGLKIAF